MTKEPRIYNEERPVSSINGIGKNWPASHKKMKLDQYLIQSTTINSKLIKGLDHKTLT